MNKNFYKKEFLSSYIFIGFTVMAAVMGLFCLKETVAGLETPTAEGLLRGKWPLQFESEFRKALPVSTASRNIWGRAEYAVFQEGRKGVVIGADGWLFTDEEFSCPPNAAQNLSENLASIDSTQRTLAAQNIRLAIVLIPAKARVLADRLGVHRLPPCREHLYANVQDALTKRHIAVTDLLPAMMASPAREQLYLKTDTHWSPAGTKISAQSAANLIRTAFHDLELPVSRFTSQEGGIKEHAGDLTSYIPGIVIPPERFTTYASGVSIASTQAATDLFDDQAPSVTLVGTSYSANQNWNFEGFLKAALKADILNAATEGQGPFVAMDKYLQNSNGEKSPARLMIWEIPERYLLMPHGMPAPAH